MGLELAAAVIRIRADTRRFATDLLRSRGRMNGQMRRMGTGLGRTLGQFMGIAAGTFFVKFIKDSLKAAGEIQAAKAGLASLAVGGQVGADKLVGDILDLTKANRGIVSFKDSIGAAQKLLGQDIPQSDMLEQLNTFTIALAGAGQGKDVFKRFILAIGQVAGRGVLEGQELRQLTETMLITEVDLARQLGVQASEIKQLTKDKKITFKDVTDTLKAMTSEGGKFFGSVERFARTLPGTVRGMENEFFLLKAAVGEALAPIAFDVMAGLNSAIMGMSGSIKSVVAGFHKMDREVSGVLSSLLKMSAVMLVLAKTVPLIVGALWRNPMGVVLTGAAIAAVRYRRELEQIAIQLGLINANQKVFQGQLDKDHNKFVMRVNEQAVVIADAAAKGRAAEIKALQGEQQRLAKLASENAAFLKNAQMNLEAVQKRMNDTIFMFERGFDILTGTGSFPERQRVDLAEKNQKALDSAILAINTRLRQLNNAGPGNVLPEAKAGKPSAQTRFGFRALGKSVQDKLADPETQFVAKANLKANEAAVGILGKLLGLEQRRQVLEERGNLGR